MITLTLNGEERSLPGERTIQQFLEERGVKPQYVVVELNGAIVPRERYAETPLRQGDVVEMVQMMGGG